MGGVTFMPPQERTRLPAGFVWKGHAVYLVRVAYKPTNPIHQALLHVGFLDEKTGQPAAGSEIWRNNYERPLWFAQAHYLEVVQELTTIQPGA